MHVSAVPLSEAEERKIVEQLIARVPPEARARGVTVKAHALVGASAPQAIVAAAERFTSSVICLGSRSDAGISKRLFGSTAQGVFEGSKRLVLIVRPPEP